VAGAPAVAAEADANGARGSRRRRSRGRRTQRPSTLAAGAYPDSHTNDAPSEGHGEADDHDDGDDDVHASDVHEDAEPGHGEGPEHHEPSPSQAPAAAPDRSPFSFFSWIRREPAPEAPPEPEETDPERRRGE
jgi:hypothetical protein